MATNLKYYAQKREDGYPIPSTMMGFAKVPTATNLIEIKPENSAAGVGEKEVPSVTGLRYFVRRTKSGDIIPNSLITSIKAPATGFYYEFKLVVPA